MTTETVSVLLVDDHPVVRSGLAGLLSVQADIEVVGEAADGAEALRKAAELAPAVILMDISMPGTDGIEATRRLSDDGYAGAIVMLTSFADKARVTEALKAGAIGYLLKDCTPDEVVAAIRSAAAGHSPLDPRVAGALLPSREAAPGAELSVRERQVLDLVAQGLANKQIARRLEIAERTVKVHVGNIFRRIGVSDRTSAALWARDNL
ncbi:MAG: two component transcriptional regulator, LuxR family [Marmoricola sp.]|nr:two component transcriptional regulator, LuxR family [Marmoricola sp.]